MLATIPCFFVISFLASFPFTFRRLSRSLCITSCPTLSTMFFRTVRNEALLLPRFVSIVGSFPSLVASMLQLVHLFRAAQTKTHPASTSRSSSPYLPLMSNSFDRGGFSYVSSLEAYQSCSVKRTRYHGSATMCKDFAFLSMLISQKGLSVLT